MAHKLVATFKVILSDDPKEFATAVADISAAWSGFNEHMQNFNAEVTFTIETVRTSTPIEKRGRKKKAGNDKQADLLPGSPEALAEMRKQVEAQSMAHQPRYTPGQGPPLTGLDDGPLIGEPEA